ncbi:ABC transporter ATP-binding protein [Streptomyces phaeochromogenes]
MGGAQPLGKTSGLRLLGLLRPDRALCGVVLALSLVSVCLSAAGPLLLGRATDIIVVGAAAGRGPGATGGVDFHALGTQLVWAALAYGGTALSGVLQARMMTLVVGRLVSRTRRNVGDKLTRLPLGYFDRHSRGEVLSRATHDVDTIGQSLQQTLNQPVVSAATAVVVLVAMAWISVPLLLVTLLTMPLYVLAAIHVGRRAQPQFVAHRRAVGELNAHVEETYRGLSVIQGLGREAEFAETFAKANRDLAHTALRSQFLSGLIRPVMVLLGNVNYALIAAVGGLGVANGTLSVGQVQAFLLYSREYNRPFTQLASLSNLLQAGTAAAARVFELLDEDEEEDEEAAGEADEEAAERHARPTGAASREPGVGHITFEKVSFAYPGGPVVIDDVDLEVRPGRTVAVVGATGSGKTTLVNLLMRFYDVSAGRILLDGTDLAALPRDTARRNFGMVLQDTWLFHSTIAENIAYGAPSASREEVVRAARAACADRLIRGLPQGYETVVGEQGAELSAGERQLITIARAFITRPAVLILDEATSQVDTRTEVLIRRATSALRVGRTSFVIAHRLSTIRDADLILCLDRGRIVERGTHASLLAAGGPYARLCAAQSSRSLKPSGHD